MAQNSGIEWLVDSDGREGSTWNPFAAFNIDTNARGWFCVHVDDGCPGCYAGSMNRFRGTGLDYIAQNLDKHRFEIIRDEKSQSDIRWPLRAARPRRIFPCSMTDLFASWYPDEWLDEAFATMICAHWHTFIITTKQETRMVEYLMHPDREARWIDAVGKLLIEVDRAILRRVNVPSFRERMERMPLPNVLIGVSISNQKSADKRRDYLRTISNQGWWTWASYEPALSPINWSGWEFLDWLVSGGESGVHARPSHPDCHRGARDFATANSIDYFFKQWGKYFPVGRLSNRAAATPSMRLIDDVDGDEGALQVTLDGRILQADCAGRFPPIPPGTAEMLSIGKQKQHGGGNIEKSQQKAPPVLDGRQWHQFPDLRLPMVRL